MKLALALLAAMAALPGALLGESAVPSGLRTALLIGNGSYPGCQVPGVEQSLNAVERSLQKEGFTVVRHENLKKKDDLHEAVDQFVRSVPTNGVALVYYVGLGAHLERNGWQNLLRPTGEDIKNDGDYRNVGLNVEDRLLEPLRTTSGSRISLVFLDACWESPIKPDSDKVISGMHELEPGDDTVVLLSAKSGEALPLPGKEESTAMAKALAKHAGQLNQSLRGTCTAIANDLNQPWASEAPEAGLGSPPSFATVDRPDQGKETGTAFVNSLGMVFRWCPAGSFKMGSERADSAETRDRKAVKVTLSKGFWMGECEVTQREYKAVVRKDPAPGFTRHRNAPFYGVFESKNVGDFCKKLTELERKAGTLPNGWEYACPTEAQWEYACRAGSTSAYCFGDSPAELGFYGNFADQALKDANPDYHWADSRSNDGVAEALAPVGSFRPNAWGLRDMHGNVAEIVSDHLLPELPGGTDPISRVEKDGRVVIRGGAWCSLPGYCESSFRNTPPSRNKSNFIGFRVVLRQSDK